ncbi:helix-turn-helix domain-containing protein [Actinokineospora sp.]|uniref:helix-turn-helix domain-containing protein n=1 Tax=Actinokineospora sp. TaxID=1872133 RepID=UPI004037BA2F
MTESIPDPVPATLRLLGAELRRARRARGWTLRDLAERLPVDISRASVAGYEYGTQQCTVQRLIEICDALAVSAPRLLARVFTHSDTEIDLRTLAGHEPGDHDAGDFGELGPLRRWARATLDHNPAATGTARLDAASFHALATLCGITPADLAGRLHQYRPRSAARTPVTGPLHPPGPPSAARGESRS